MLFPSGAFRSQNLAGASLRLNYVSQDTDCGVSCSGAQLRGLGQDCTCTFHVVSCPRGSIYAQSEPIYDVSAGPFECSLRFRPCFSRGGRGLPGTRKRVPPVRTNTSIGKIDKGLLRVLPGATRRSKAHQCPALLHLPRLPRSLLTHRRLAHLQNPAPFSNPPLPEPQCTPDIQPYPLSQAVSPDRSQDADTPSARQLRSVPAVPSPPLAAQRRLLACPDVENSEGRN